MQKQLRQLPSILGQIAEFSQIILPSMLQRSVNLGGSVGKGIQIISAIFGLIKKGLIVAFIAAIWTYLYQYHHQLVNAFHNDEKDFLTEVGFTKLEDKLPKEPPEVWFFLGVVMLIIIIQIGRFTKNLLTPDHSLSDRK